MIKLQSIFLVGPMGAGKTSIGTYLAKELKMDFYDSDQVIEQRTGVDIPWIFDVEGEHGFRQREIAVIDELTQRSGIVLATGGGSILEGENRKNLATRGYVIYLQATLDQQYTRIENDTKRPLIHSGDRRETLERLAKERNPFYQEIADMTFSTDGRSVRAVAGEVLQYLLEKFTVS